MMARMGHFADLLNSTLTRRGITRYKLYQATGVAQSLLSKYASGKGVPEPSTISKIAEALDADLGEMLAAADADRLGLDRLEAINRTVSQGSKTRKPWPLHDLGQTSANTHAQQASVKQSNEMSTSNEQTFGIGNQSGNVDIRTGDKGHVMPFQGDFGPTKRLPVYRVSCGEPVFINDAPEDWQAWPVEWVGDVDGIMLVKGTSMLGAGINPGDRIFFQLINGRRPKSGELVVAEVNNEAVCKMYQRDESGEYLVSAPGDDPEDRKFFCRVSPEVRLVGIVRQHLRRM